MGQMSKTRSVPRWYEAPPPAGYPKHERGSVVETLLLGTDDAHASILQLLEVEMSVAVGEAIGWVKDRIRPIMDDDPTGATKRKRLVVADLVLEEVERGLPTWVQKLFDAVPGAVPVEKPSNAVRIVWGEIREQRVGKERVKAWECRHLHPKFQLQQFFLKVLPPEISGRLPKPLRPGMTQEVGQQLTSHLMLADSGTVALAAYPATDERDPARRRLVWEAALERVCRRAETFPYQKAREIDPSKYRPDDPKGNREVNMDPDWHSVAGSPEARRSPLLFVAGGDVKLYRRVWQRPGKRRGEPPRVSRATYAAIPVDKPFLDVLAPELQAAAGWWKRPEVLATLLPLLAASRPLRSADPVLLAPLTYGRRRTERRILPALSRLPIQWARLVHRTYRRGGAREKWFLQLTIGYAAPKPFPARVLGIHFGLDNVYYWALAQDRGAGEEPLILEEGHFVGNPILRHGLAEKADLEWDQAKERWVGGRVYAPALRGDTHLVVNGMLALAKEKGTEGLPAGIGVERIRFVPKGQGSPEENRRFSAWDYGQLRKFIAYKGPPAQVWVTEITLKKTDRQQDDAEQARRLAREATHRLHDRRLRADERAREAGEHGEE